MILCSENVLDAIKKYKLKGFETCNDKKILNPVAYFSVR